MANNYVLLERIELNASAASVTFANIPQSGYTDLKVVVSARNSVNSTGMGINFNSNTSGYSYRRVWGDGASASSGQGSAVTIMEGMIALPAANYTSNTFGNAKIYIPNYTSSNYKSVSVDAVTENNASTSYTELYAGLWSNTAAITSILFTPADSGSFVQYSTFSLYGLAAVGTTPAIAPKARGGNNITTDGTYWYHTFLASGTFTPLASLSCDYLVVGGGGAGAGGYGGGGGAGGLRSTVTATGGGGSLESKLSVTATSYTITVGAGGVGGSANTSTNGTDSTFSTITSTGGGRGASGANGVAGGSGGGAGGRVYTGGSATPSGQGYAGGNANYNNSAVSGAGGGGGAGQIGGNATFVSGTTGTSGNGGNGVAISTFATATNTGVSNYYAGGGGGAARIIGETTPNGTGGSGGGGAGATTDSGTPTAGTVNTGGAGGGAGTNGANGGSGIVIIRYTIA